ncbi:hypothetical protein JNUCC0626_32295 [Lentzea sp. JNUCC 0626]|uniref:hypothetical protein n=1 Tax=Lentzea sp. JNUCC 0626 TaxID=3367513 RepID=UPI003748028D
MSDGYGVDLEALRAAERGIVNTIRELREAGYHGQERSGQTVIMWKLDVSESGHQVITDDLDTFLDRLRWWIRGLIAGTEEIVQGLADTRSTYEKVEEDITKTVKSLMDMTFGNPLGNQAPPAEAPR